MNQTLPPARFRCLLAVSLLITASPAFAQRQQDYFIPEPAARPGAPPAGQPGQGQPPAGQTAQGQGQGQPPAGRPGTPPARPPATAPAAGNRLQAPPPLPPGQQPPAAVIGIVDIPEIQRVSTAFNQVREEIEKRRARLNDDLQREQNSWREAQQQLANQRAAMPPDALRDRERGLQDRITDSQRIFRERSRAIEQAAQQALVEIEQALGNVIRQVAASRNVNLVVPRTLVIFNDAPFDLTAEVAQQFNRSLRSVTMPPDAGAAPAPRAAAPAPTPAPAAPAPAPATPAGDPPASNPRR
jgi:Skp family chaperone for outer membrane proteins